MGYFDYKRPAIGSYLDRRNPPYMWKHTGLGSTLLGRGDKISAMDANVSGPQDKYNHSRFNPQKDRLEEGSILEEWIPRQPTALHLMLRKIYLRDAIAGSVVDIMSTLPFGKFYELIGIDDPKVLQMFQDMIEAINLWEELPMICRELLIIGRNIGSLSFNERAGHWDALTPIDPDQAKIQPLPVSGEKPLIDVLSSPAWREFARSVDPRIVEIKERMNPSLFEKVGAGSGYIPLDPLNTLWLARRVNQYDHIGTSLYTRILPAWAYEMALWNASLTGVRRRNRSILLVTAGIEESWEPTEDEIASLTSLFMQADEDPTGAVIAVRQGVEVSEVRDPTAIWGVSQEFEFLSAIKMRALGVSEAYLSGETNVSNMEAARTSLGKQLASFRDWVLSSLFTKQLFPTFARIHNMQKRSEAELSHRIRINAKTATDIPLEQLMIPQIITEDTLRPVEDIAYIEMLKAIKEEGVPVPLRIFASAAGYDLDKAMAMMEEDGVIRKRLAQFGSGGGEGGGEGGSSGMEFGGEGGSPAEEPSGGEGEEPKEAGPGGGAADLFGGGAGADTTVEQPVLPPRWTATSEFIEKEKLFLEKMKNSNISKVLSRIEPRLLAELSIPNSRAIIPYKG